jgi:hypothetical protein
MRRCSARPQIAERRHGDTSVLFDRPNRAEIDLALACKNSMQPGVISRRFYVEGSGTSNLGPRSEIAVVRSRGILQPRIRGPAGYGKCSALPSRRFG